MIKLLVVAAASFVVSGQSAGAQRGWLHERDDPIETCKTGRLAPHVDAMIRPVLLARSVADRARRANDSLFNAQFARIMADTTASGREGRAALMAYYIGDAPGEALLAEARRDVAHVHPLIVSYRACRPRGSFEKDIPSIPVVRRLYWKYFNE